MPLTEIAMFLIGLCVGVLVTYLGVNFIDRSIISDPFKEQELLEKLQYALKYVDGLEKALKEEIQLRHHETSTLNEEFYSTLRKIEIDCQIDGPITLEKVDQHNK